MPTYAHKCDECEHYDDFVRYSLAEFDANETMICPECGKPTWKRIMVGAPAFDIVGYCYDNEYGKKAWKRNLSPTEQAKVVAGERSPY